MIEQVETVSAHFQYSEEYVLDRSPEWIKRKYIQAAREKHETHRQRIVESFKGITLLVDTMLNKGKAADQILPPAFDTFLQEHKKEQEKKEEYIEGQWWQSKEDEEIPAQT